MSCYEWEAGTILLPTAAAPKVRDAVKAALEKHKVRLYNTAQEFWKALPSGHKRDRTKYGTAVRAFVHGNTDDVYDQARKAWVKQPLDAKLPAWKGFDNDGGRVGFADDLYSLLGSVLYRNWIDESRGFKEHKSEESPPRRIQQKDVDTQIGKATGASFSLQVGEGFMCFEGRKLRWEVGENNHAREYGRDHPVAKVLFAELDKVTWTRGSGGKIVGNDEYNRDTDYEGGGGNYVVTEYGPHIKKVPTSRYALSRW